NPRHLRVPCHIQDPNRLTRCDAPRVPTLATHGVTPPSRRSATTEPATSDASWHGAPRGVPHGAGESREPLHWPVAPPHRVPYPRDQQHLRPSHAVPGGT